MSKMKNLMDFSSYSSRQLAAIIILWAASLVLSISALSLSAYMLGSERINWSCEDNGHCYEARYDVTPPNSDDLEKLKEAFGYETNRLEAMDKLNKKTYVKDTCNYCGKSLKP